MSNNSDSKLRKVGVLVVHGIGEQLPNQQRNAVAESLVKVWQSKYGRSNVSSENGGNECRILIRTNSASNNDSVRVEVREAYWADLDENPQGVIQGFLHSIRFWVWGLSQWAERRYAKCDLPGARKMILPIPDSESHVPLKAKWKLFGVGVVFALFGATWELLRFLLRRFKMVGSGMLVRYLGDVQLYTENEYRFRPGPAAITDAPRDAIRRRMVSNLISMAVQEYDSWYIVAHSLGSVVAHNGLMEIAEALPNYLDEKEWGLLNKSKHRWLLEDPKKVDSNVVRNMRPGRPSWLNDTDAISRKALFSKLKGFCTYGSPLDKFATLWPATVPINKDTQPLEKCPWINVHDRMDPIAGALDRFDKTEKFVPDNVPYKSSRLFLLAHTSYLKRTSGDGFAERLGDWIVTGNKFKVKITIKFGGGKVRDVGKYAWWFGLSVLAATPLTLLVKAACGNCAKTAYNLMKYIVAGDSLIFSIASYLFLLLCVVGIATALTLVASISRRRKPHDRNGTG